MVIANKEHFGLRKRIGFICQSNAVDFSVLRAFAYGEHVDDVWVCLIQVKERRDDFNVAVIM